MTEDLHFLHSSFAGAVSGAPLGLPGKKDVFCGMVSRSGLMKDIFGQIERIADVDDDVLVVGEPGTGKRLVVDAIHKLSSRAKGPFVSLNCGVIPEGLLESELFGTPDTGRGGGRLGAAVGGVLFLNEVGSLSRGLQMRLVELIDDRRCARVGVPPDFDVRIMASTSKDLDKAVEQGAFDRSLLDRLGRVSVSLPKLSERREDISLLVAYFAERYGSTVVFAKEVVRCLSSYGWPGNIGELENLIERLAAVRAGGQVTVDDLPARYLPTRMFRASHFIELPEEGIDLKALLVSVEDSLIDQALSRTSGNKNRASKLLGIKRTTLIEKLRKRAFDVGCQS